MRGKLIWGLVLERDRRLTGHTFGSRNHHIAPEGYELTSAWRVCARICMVGVMLIRRCSWRSGSSKNTDAGLEREVGRTGDARKWLVGWYRCLEPWSEYDWLYIPHCTGIVRRLRVRMAGLVKSF